MLFSRGGGVRDDVVVGVVSYVAQPEFLRAPFAEVVAAISGMERVDVSIIGGAYAADLTTRLIHYHEHRRSDVLGVRAIMDNDANVGALGEAIYGAGKAFRPLFYMTLSTGIGGGLIVNDGRPELMLGFEEGGAEFFPVPDVMLREGELSGGFLDLPHGSVSVGLFEREEGLGGADLGADFVELTEFIVAGEGGAQVTLEAQETPDGSASEEADGADHGADLKGHFAAEGHI